MHHSAVSRTKNPDQFVANNEYHRKKWNFKSSLGYYLGYNYEISAAGMVRQARQEGEQTAAVYQQNMNNGQAVHICLDGNFDIELPTLEQEKSLKELLIKLKAKYPDAQIAYHRQFANKTCPGRLIPDNWANNLILNNTMIVDQERLIRIYQMLLFRNPDLGAKGYIGQDEEKVINEILQSKERQWLVEIFQMVQSKP